MGNHNDQPAASESRTESVFDLYQAPDRYINKILSDFNELRQFLIFAAAHPDLSLDNLVLLYAQKPDASRYLVHRGIANFYQFPTSHGLWMLSLRLDDAKQLKYEKLCMYEVPKDRISSPDLSLRAVFDRIGYCILPTEEGTKVLVDHGKAKKISVPKSLPQAKVDAELTGIFVDYFFKAFSERGSALPITQEEYNSFYRAALVFLVGTKLKLKGIYLPKTFWQPFIACTDPDPVFRATKRKLRLTVLATMFMELDQVLEGRHFTVLETEIYQISGGDVYGSTIDATEKDPLDAYVGYVSMLQRYASDPLGAEWVSPYRVHLFPPFCLDQFYQQTQAIRR